MGLSIPHLKPFFRCLCDFHRNSYSTPLYEDYFPRNASVDTDGSGEINAIISDYLGFYFEDSDDLNSDDSDLSLDPD